ncbi:prenyltransferase [Saccharospirillum salsuginis]|uniref:1,4-dihydroxy-2-naphthoate octaprenyltransferase n=1 Tax=Saccharospirillum salsuginis TaxID=418750 RepID=A0A918K1N3_9GAMM|nr:prenyltransferase [Saccharospirillum salsuginis]GGX43084.1 1,4-dihydroxy-2-naphthoate octaprenyltransferase [Saccharospirillum salsuginis]
MIPSWREVLTQIPRLDTRDWQAMGRLKRWLVASRAAVFVMTLFSAGLGMVLAIPGQSFDVLNAVLVCIGLVLAHGTNNLVNDWTDSRKGIDKGNYFRTQYGPQPLESGFLTERQLLGYIALTGGLAIAVGLVLVLRTDIQTLYWMLAGAFFVLFYTWPLKYIGLGEPAVWLVWGPLMVLASAYVVSGDMTATMIWVSAIYGIGPATVLFGKHTDKLAEDRKKGVYTLPVLLGESNSRHTVIGLWAIQYGGLALGVGSGALSLWYLLTWLALPRFIETAKRFREPRPVEAPVDLPPGVWPLYLVAFAFDYNKRFSGWLFLAVLLSSVVG